MTAAKRICWTMTAAQARLLADNLMTVAEACRLRGTDAVALRIGHDGSTSKTAADMFVGLPEDSSAGK